MGRSSSTWTTSPRRCAIMGNELMTGERLLATPSEAEATCRAVLRALNVPAFLHRGDCLICCNGALARLLNYSENQLLAMRHDELSATPMREATPAYAA